MYYKNKISIIIPVYNVEDYIVECLDSICNQSYTDKVECILVDDCGKDNSVKLIEDFLLHYKGQIKFKLLHHSSNKGLSASRNTGTAASSGEYLLYVDSDDKLFTHSLESLLRVADKYPEAEVVQGSTLPVFTLSRSKLPEYTDNVEWIRESFCTYKISCPAWNKLIKRDFVISEKLFFKEGYLQEDNIWAFQLHNVATKVAFCFEETYWYRYNPNGIMNGIGNERTAKSFARVFNCIFDDIIKSEDIKNYEILFLENLARDVLSSSDYERLDLLVVQKNPLFIKLLKVTWFSKISFLNHKVFRLIEYITNRLYNNRDKRIRNLLCKKENLLKNFISIDYSKPV